MNNLIYTILNYIASAASVAGFVVVAKRLFRKFGDLSDIKRRLGVICQKLQRNEELTQDEIKELQELKMQLKGFRVHGKESNKKN